jgi:hypothetical protein
VLIELSICRLSINLHKRRTSRESWCLSGMTHDSCRRHRFCMEQSHPTGLHISNIGHYYTFRANSVTVWQCCCAKRANQWQQSLCSSFRAIPLRLSTHKDCYHVYRAVGSWHQSISPSVLASLVCMHMVPSMCSCDQLLNQLPCPCSC